MSSASVPVGWYRAWGKRAFDLVAASLALIVASPVLVVTALLVRLTMGSPVVFKQVRPGKDAKPFTIYKFRTMTNERGADGELLPDEDRLTGFGRLLRSTSLDELPELFNVLRGEMSLVGPRPWLMAYLDRYSPEQARRMEVRPGLTGLAQVTGRNQASWEQRLELDVRYVDSCSLRLDLSIILRTMWLVITRQGISQDGHATMPEFDGRAA